MAISYFIVPKIYGLKYTAEIKTEVTPLVEEKLELPIKVLTAEESIIVTHLETPSPVKALYISSWVASSISFREKVIKLIDEKEINSIVIDVKDNTGKISFLTDDLNLQKVNSAENRIRNIKTFIDSLHKKNIYVIGRITVFQDPFLAKKWPEVTVKKLSDQNAFWLDDKCKRAISRNSEKACTYWVDPGSIDVWNYIASIGDVAYKVGFDELNFDYIRFPADGDLKDVYYPVSNNQVRTDVINNFSKFLHDHFAGLENEKNPRPKISADIFGLATTEIGDLGIGQMLIPFANNFDYVMPMVYPSHYAPGTYGYKKPATVPYEIVNFSMKKAVDRLKIENIDPLKLRPWLQDFNLGAIYTKEMVRAQIKATYDAGLISWSLWDPANTYTSDALLID